MRAPIWHRALIAAATFAGPVLAQPPKHDAATNRFDQSAHAELSKAMQRLKDGSAPATVVPDVNRGFDLCVAYAPPQHPTLDPRHAPLVDPAEVFHYFRANRARMAFGGKLPAELMVHVVDVHASQDDLAWALKNYAGNQTVGKLFGSIMYDTAA